MAKWSDDRLEIAYNNYKNSHGSLAMTARYVSELEWALIKAQNPVAKKHKDLKFLEEIKTRLQTSRQDVTQFEMVETMIDDWIHELKEATPQSQADKANEQDAVNDALALLKAAKCPNCDGSGFTVDVRTIAVASCCGNANKDGSCCGNAIPVPEQEQYQVQCQWCAERSALIKP